MIDINPDKCSVTQPFNGNANPSYAGAGLRGHTGEDTACGYGTPIHSPFAMYVYKVLTVANPSNDGTGFTGVFGIVDNGIECFEYLIGHCNPSVVAGMYVSAGDLIGTEANHGTVYGPSGAVTLQQQKAGSHEGSHRHNQKRPVMKVLHTQPQYSYLDIYSDNRAGSIYRDLAGYYYQVFDFNNGYNGCIDPTKSVFKRDLTLGISGYDVYVLQRLLVQNGATFAPTGYFGSLTQAALGKLQGVIGLHPDAGYFGPLTRAAIQQKYSL